LRRIVSVRDKKTIGKWKRDDERGAPLHRASSRMMIFRSLTGARPLLTRWRSPAESGEPGLE
jgi:hypothetical protein